MDYDCYECVDRGSLHCPCVLMEAGQCYSCTMIRDGKCSCQDAAGWKGSCPYTEYMQGQRGSAFEVDSPVVSNKTYSASLSVVRVDVPAGIAVRCRRPGTFMMAEAAGWRTPLSVLRSGMDEECQRGGFIEFAVQPVGPKTKWLVEQKRWKMTGPYYSGLLGMSEGDLAKDALIIAKGTAAAPFVCSKERFTGQVTIYMDSNKLNDDFVQEYICGEEENIQYRSANLIDEECRMRVRNLIEKVGEEGSRKIWLLVSPFYVHELTEGLPEELRKNIIVPNPANMCCGEGICGACSHTDENGITVRLCKCTNTW